MQALHCCIARAASSGIPVSIPDLASIGRYGRYGLDGSLSMSEEKRATYFIGVFHVFITLTDGVLDLVTFKDGALAGWVQSHEKSNGAVG